MLSPTYTALRAVSNIAIVSLADHTVRTQYRRDCFDGHDYKFPFSDGHWFFLDMSAGTNLSQALPTSTSSPDNQTVCQGSVGVPGQSWVCLTICSGDFCNGPRYDPSSETPGNSGGGGVKYNNGVL